MSSRLEKKLARDVARASKDFGLFEPDDRVMVAISGGKDSYTMLHILRHIARRVPFGLEIIAVNLDQGQPGFPVEILRSWLQDQGYEHRIIYRDTYSIVKEKVPEGKTTCSLCSRLRRGILYNVAEELGCTKIALGHHRDDVIETLLLNLLYSGQLKAMPPLLRSDDGRNTVIRPLVYCREDEIAAFAEEMAFPILPCDLCGSQENLQRKKIKRLLSALEADNPKIKGNLFAALGNVRPSHLLDRKMWELIGIEAPQGEDPSLGPRETLAPQVP
ncbi:MAG: tRNA 2-thiocytidine(32) synthetase TtcA [Deltaproteobacteria bacterium]|nr:MAG: tRNA 2-thiocytidine(32) synthetase TtcA [Deltaproteobacteria bacterium]